jgi:hypothetical protein
VDGRDVLRSLHATKPKGKNSGAVAAHLNERLGAGGEERYRDFAKVEMRGYFLPSANLPNVSGFTIRLHHQSTLNHPKSAVTFRGRRQQSARVAICKKNFSPFNGKFTRSS